jgi:glycosyltransferase involved in cell wall biosynthesis
MDGSNKLTCRRVVVATHVYTTGPAQDLRDYLIKEKVEDLLYIGHPLFYSPKLEGSGYSRYKKGNSVSNSFGSIKKSPDFLAYTKAIFLNIWYVLVNKGKWDLYVGSNNLNTLSGVLLKWVGLVDKVVYYVIDYNPKRFKNKLLNHIYHKIDHICVTHSDVTWNLSPRMLEGRKKYFNFTGGNQITVPIGVWLDRISENARNETLNHTLVFMGHVLKKQGIQYVLEAIPHITKEIPDFKFVVLGGGDYIDELKILAQKNNISEYVEFKGYIEEHSDLEIHLSKCSLAIALYEKHDEKGDLTFTYFADPAKLKVYMACGLPVITTDVPHNASKLEKRNIGRVITNDPLVISEAVVDLFGDDAKLREMKSNALQFAKEFNWDVIFGNVLNV